MTDLENYLKSYFFVEERDMNQITNLFKETSLEKGEFFLKEGHYCDKLSFIKSGLIRIYADKDDKRITQWIATPGYFLTDLSSLVFDTTARWTMETLSPCEFYTISKYDYNRIGKLITGWSELEKRFLANCFITLEQRVFHFLSCSAEERYRFLFENNPALFNQVPLQHIASMLGMTPETFSRIRAKIARE